MSKLLSAATLMVVGLVVLIAACPTITYLTNVLIPLVLVVGFIAAMLRLVWFYTRD